MEGGEREVSNPDRVVEVRRVEFLKEAKRKTRQNESKGGLETKRKKKKSWNSQAVVRSVKIPGPHFGRSIPGDEDLTRSIREHRHVGKSRRVSRPVGSKGSVTLHVPNSKLDSVDDVSSGIELCELRAEETNRKGKVRKEERRKKERESETHVCPQPTRTFPLS